MAAEQPKRDTQPEDRRSYRTALAERVPWRLVGAVALVLVGATTYSRFVTDEESDGGSNGNGDEEIDLSGPDEPGVTTTFADPGEPDEPICPARDGSSPRRVNFSSPPPMCIDPTLELQARIATSRGYFDIALDSETAPNAVNNFVFLALWHYYDGVAFHRVVPNFVIQGGDAVGRGPDCEGAGCGGPGYQFHGERPAGGPPFYPMSSVAMANNGPGTDGSQFFIVVGERGEQLPPDYSRLGSVIAGMPVVEAIAATGETVNAMDTPDDLTVIESVTVFQRPLPVVDNDGGVLDPGD